MAIIVAVTSRLLVVLPYLFRQHQLEEVPVQNSNTTATFPAALVVAAAAFRALLALALAITVTLEADTPLARCSVVTTAGEGVEEGGAVVVVNVELQPPKEASGLQLVRVEFGGGRALGRGSQATDV